MGQRQAPRSWYRHHMWGASSSFVQISYWEDGVHVIHTPRAPRRSRLTLETQNLEHLPLPLNPFEFPRPFEVFEGGCF